MSKQRLFEVGDKVRSNLWAGMLKITKVDHTHRYSIEVRESACATHTFTEEGCRMLGDTGPSLYHAETGSPCVVGEPPERFEYPLYMESKYGLIVKFTALCTATVLRARPDSFCDGVDVSSAHYCKHTDRRTWTPCEKPAWKPTKPTWCWVWNDYRADALRRIVRHSDIGNVNGFYYVVSGDSRARYKHAEPCGQDQIPEYWPTEWI